MDKRNSFAEGQVLLIDKPYTWTSFDVVKKIRNCIDAKVGHAGTLDPLATGLLILCTGKMTKQIEDIQQLKKSYSGSFEMGATTPSYDLETEIDQRFPLDNVSKDDVYNVVKSFIGEYKHYPPAYSAVKINGKRAYERSRKGEKFVINPKFVEIYKLVVEEDSFPIFNFNVECSKGTYIRTLVSDIGKKLMNGAYLSSLRRTAIGDYHVDSALTPEKMIKKIKTENLESL